jgi:hypothetical protein
MSFSSDKPLLANQLPISIDFPSPDKKEFLDILSLTYKRIADSVNTKEGGLYLLQELATFNQFFTLNNNRINRFVYRTTFDMVNLNGGPIGTGTTASFAHNITGVNTPTNIYGTATTSTGKFIPLPYVDVTTESSEIQIYATSTNIVLVTGATIDGGANTLTQAYIIFEYTKN